MFEAREMTFGIDGLESEWTVLTSESSDECYRTLIEQMKQDRTFLGRVVSVDPTGKVMRDENFSVVEAAWPDFYHDYFRLSKA